jgi:hypothetical protein
MKNYKVTIHLTKSGDTEIKESEFGGRTPEESLSNLLEMAFAFGRDPEVENFSVMMVEEIKEAEGAAA